MHRTKQRQVDVFRLLSSRGVEMFHFGPREIIFSQGEESDSVFYLESGVVKLTVRSGPGNAREAKNAVIEILHEGAFFGENALAPHRPPRTNNAVALSRVRTAKVDPEVILDLSHEAPDFCAALISHLISLKNRLQDDLASALLHTSEKRLARVLASIAALREDGRPKTVPKMSQQELAGMIGVTRQRVNFLLGRFRKMGFIDYDDGLTVNPSILKLAGRNE